MRRQPRRASTVQQPPPALRIRRQPIEAVRVQNKESFKAPETILPISPDRPISAQSWTKDDSIQPRDSLAHAVVNEHDFWMKAPELLLEALGKQSLHTAASTGQSPLKAEMTSTWVTHTARNHQHPAPLIFHGDR